MSKPITIPLTNLKRNWKFIWQLGESTNSIASSNFGNIANTAGAIAANAVSVAGTISNFAKDVAKAFKENGLKNALSTAQYGLKEIQNMQILSDTVLTMYVSQLAKSITLPDDEVEFEMLPVGNVEYPVASKSTMNPITVSYYDDNLDTVYNYHKLWQNCIRTDSGNEIPGMTMNPINGLTLAAKYIVYEDSLSMLEYSYLLKWLNRGMSALTSATEKITAYFNLPDTSELGEVVDPFLKWHSTQTS